MTSVSYPLSEDALEAIPHNKRRTEVVRLARSLGPAEQKALAAALCAPQHAGVEKQAVSEKLRSDDLARFISSSPNDPTSTYHLQEVGLLVAASCGQKQYLLDLAENKNNKLIADRALHLAINSSCVDNSEILDLFNRASERTKRSIIRACAHATLRQEITDSIVEKWLNDSHERQIVACEILHLVSTKTSYFSNELRKIVLNRRIMLQNKVLTTGKSKSYEGACFAALRFDVMWKFHGPELLEMISQDLQKARGPIGYAAVFDFWDPVMNASTWSFPGKKTPHPSQLSKAESFVAFRDLLELYITHLPFEPRDASVKALWHSERFNGSIHDQRSSTLLRLLENLQDKFHRTWSDHIALVIPAWMQDRHLYRNVGDVAVFEAVVRYLADDEGILNPVYSSLSELLFSKLVSGIMGRPSPAFVAAVVSYAKKAFKLVTPAMYYTGSLSIENYPSSDAYERDQAVSATFSRTCSFMKSLLANPQMLIGQQLDLFLALADLNRSFRLQVADLQNPLHLVPVDRIEGLLKKYRQFLQPYVHEVIGSISARIKRASERGQNTTTLDAVFKRVVSLGFEDVQKQVENSYSALSESYPKAFGTLPMTWYVETLASSLVQRTSTRRFLDGPDVACKQLNDLVLSVIFPSIRQGTFGEEALFSDRPGHFFGVHKGTNPHITTRVNALESMEVIRQQWFGLISKTLKAPIGQGVLSDEAAIAYLDFLADWLALSQDSVQKGTVAARANKYSTEGKSEYPEKLPRAEASVSQISQALLDFLTERCNVFQREEWHDKEQASNVTLIQRAFRLWTSANYFMDGDYPLKPEGPGRLNPYTMETMITTAYKVLPPVARAPFDDVLHQLFALRLNGKVRLADGTLMNQPFNRRSRNDQPWQDCAALIETCSAKHRSTAHELLSYLEKLPKDERASPAFLKEMERFMDLAKPGVRQRLEHDLTKPTFADRVKCFSVLLQATVSSKSSAETIKTLARLQKLIENENHSNRMQGLDLLHGAIKSILETSLPRPSGGGQQSDRGFVLFLHSPPHHNEWPSIIDASTEIPKVLLKLLDDFLDSTDEKNPQDLRKWRTSADEIVRAALTWPCSLLPDEDSRITEVQRAWFECAIEIHWHIAMLQSGRAQAAGTFRPTLSATTISRIRNFIFEAGYQPDRPFPYGKEETREWEAEGARRRQDKARFIVKLFEDAYSSRIGDAPMRGTPLGRKLAIEKKRLLDLLNVVQGEWINCAFISDRLEDVVEQVALPETTTSHQLQVLELMKTCAEASLTWGVRVRDSRPPWALAVANNSVESIQRERKRGGPKRINRRRLGRGGRQTTPVDSDEEDAPWIASKYFKFLPSLIPRYWEIIIRTFGVHHPAGLGTGKCILRMFLRWNFAIADSALTRAERQTIRCNVSLSLLDICQSAVHLRVVQSTLKDFRQDLLEKYVFSHDKSDPILGKFSDLSANEGDDIVDDASDGSEAQPKTVKPFRLHGFYGYNKLTARQGKRLAGFLIEDVEDPELSVMERVAAATKLTFLPAVGYMDLAAILTTHFDKRIKYAEAVRRKKLSGEEITVTPPLSDSVVETLFKSVLLDTNPSALFSLLTPSMMRESSTKTTILVAQRLVLMLNPTDVTEVIRVLLSRKGREGLLVGPVKALLRILFHFSSQSINIIGSEVIQNAVDILEKQWSRPDLHQDARAVIIYYAVKGLSQFSNEFNDTFSWRVLYDTASNRDINDSLRALLLCVEPAIEAISTIAVNASNGFSNEFVAINTEAQRQGKVVTREKARFLELLIKAIETTELHQKDAEARMLELGNDRRKLGAVRKQASLAADLRALLLLNLGRWVTTERETYYSVMTLFSSNILALDNEKPSDENLSRYAVCSNYVPRSFAQLASASSSLSTSHLVYEDAEAGAKIQDVLRTLIDGLLGQVPLTQPNKRARFALALSSVANNLSKEYGKRSLHRQAFLVPFKEEMGYLKRETETMESLCSLANAASIADPDKE